MFVNGLVHFFVAFKTQSYNPGVVTGAILFIPLTLYFLNKLIMAGSVQYSDLYTLIPIVFFGSMMIPYSVFLFRDKNARK